jgi:hypothetical protein
MHSDPSTPPPSIPGLLKDLRNETVTLFRQEVALAKAELKENTARAASHATHVAVGAFVAYAGIIVLLIGLGQLLGALLMRAGMSADLATWLAPSIVGLAIALIGWGMLAKARKALAHDDLMPRQTLASLRDNKQWAENKLQHSS